MLKRFAFMTFLLMSPALHSQAAANPTGVASSSCGAFNAAVANEDATETARFVAWALGYLTGRIDEGATLEGEFPEGLADSNSVYEQLVAQCGGNGTELFIDAVREAAADKFGR
jgi:hypothetical protein